MKNFRQIKRGAQIEISGDVFKITDTYRFKNVDGRYAYVVTMDGPAGTVITDITRAGLAHVTPVKAA